MNILNMLVSVPGEPFQLSLIIIKRLACYV